METGEKSNKGDRRLIMKDWKDLKDKEVIIGLIIIIILGLIAVFLLIRREVGYQKVTQPAVEEAYEAEPGILETAMEEGEENLVMQEESEDSDVAEKEEAKQETSLANVQIVTEETGKKIEEENKKKVTLYDVLGNEKYKPATLTERKEEDNQLKELYEYWDAYKLDAVMDLVNLERMQKVSKELNGKNKFYYYGSVDRLGRPSGKGLAVYGDNTYYFGEWKEGLRHGKGMWMQVVIYTEDNKKMNLGLMEHSYNGQWSKDLPNGQGQEHFSYDYSILKEEYIKNNECFSNVIGGFKDGYYHGEMYVMSTDEHGNTTDWSGQCNSGVWEPIIKGNTTDAVFEGYDKDENGNNVYHYMFPQDNQNYGIIGLKK